MSLIGLNMVLSCCFKAKQMNTVVINCLLTIVIILAKLSFINAQISPVPAGFNCDEIIFSESFENGIPVGWNSLSVDRAKGNFFNEGWVIDRDTTFTTATGPEGAQDGVFYIYCDGSGPIGRGSFVALTSPLIDLTDVNEPALSFYLNMHGRSGIFYVNVVEGANVIQALSAVDGNVAGGVHTANVWEEVHIDLSGYINKTIAIQLVAQKPLDPHNGDVAIDNLVVCSKAIPAPIPTISLWCLLTLSSMFLVIGWKLLR